jgi:hypothetical protein
MSEDKEQTHENLIILRICTYFLQKSGKNITRRCPRVKRKLGKVGIEQFQSNKKPSHGAYVGFRITQPEKWYQLWLFLGHHFSIPWFGMHK